MIASVRKPYLLASYHVSIYFDWFLVCGISLPAAQLFVIAIENILRGCVGKLTRSLVCQYITDMHCHFNRTATAMVEMVAIAMTTFKHTTTAIPPTVAEL